MAGGTKITVEEIVCLHNAVLEEFPGCSVSDIAGMCDTPVKKFTVFMFEHFYCARHESLSKVYNINRHYVSTVSKMHAQDYADDEIFRQKVHRVLDKMEVFYEKMDKT